MGFTIVINIVRVFFVVYAMVVILSATLVYGHVIEGSKFVQTIQMLISCQTVAIFFEGAIVIVQIIRESIKDKKHKQLISLSTITAPAIFHVAVLNSSLSLINSAQNAKFLWTEEQQQVLPGDEAE